MKPLRRNTSLLSLSAIFLSYSVMVLESARATTLYWDTNGTTAGSGAATGTWDTSTASWTTDSTGVTAPNALTTSILDNLFFSAGTSGTTGTVTVSGTRAANSITFDDPVAVTISGGTGITLGGSSGAGIFQTGAGTVTNTISSALTLNGAQAWTNSTSGSTLAISGTVTRNTGGAVNFTPTGTINLTGSGLTNDASGILGGWATTGNSGVSGATADWAAIDGSGNIVTYTGYTDVASGNQTGAGASAQNWRTVNTGVQTNLTAGATINSLVVRSDFNISSGATMTLGSGGLILSGISRWIKNNGNGDTAGTGQITSGLASGELFVDVASSTSDANNWIIWTKAVDNGGTAVKLVKNGPGSVRLANSNTYTGGTIVNSGTLFGSAAGSFGAGAIQVNSGASLSTNLSAGTMANNFAIATGASVTIDNASNNGTLNGNFSGGGAVTIQNTSTANLSENVGGDWSGFTGTLNYNTASKVVNFFAPASFDLSHAAVNFANSGNLTNSSFRTSSTGTTKLGSLAGFGYLDANGATEIGNLGTNTTFSGVIRAAGSITKVGSGTLILSGANTYTGATTVNGGTLQMNSSNATSVSITVNSGGTLSLNITDALGVTAGKNVPTINSGGTIGNITSAARVTLWNGLTMTGGTLTGTGTGDANGAYSLSGTVIATSDASGTAATMGGTGSISLQNQNTNNGSITFNVTRGSATPASDLTVTANLIPYTGLTEGISKTGTGIMTLSGANTYTGGTAINGGTLALGSSGAIGTTGTITFGGGALQYSASNTTDYSSRFSTAASQAYSVDTNGQNVTWATALTSSGGSLSKSGSGTLILNGNNTYTGATTVGGGTLQLGNADAVKNSTVSISSTNGLAFGTGIGAFNLGGLSGASNQTLTDAGNNAVTMSVGANNASTTYSGVLSGIGAVAKVGTGALTLSNANTHSGGTTLNSGTLAFGNSAAFGSGGVTLNGGTLKAAGANLTLGNNIAASGASVLDMAANNTTLNGNLSGSAALTLNNSSFAATLGLGGNNSGYTGTITFNNNSAVSFNSANAGSAGAAWVFNDTSVDRVRINIGTGTIGFGSISGGGQMQNDAASSSAKVSVGALNTSTTFSGTMKDNGTGILALTKVGTGTLTLSGASTYTGATTIDSGGTLALGSTGSISNSSVIAVNGTLDTTARSSYTIGASQTLKGAGTVAVGSGNALIVDGIVAAGNSPGVLTIRGGTTTFDSGSIFAWELNDDVESTTGIRGSDYDGLTVTEGGSLTVASGAIFKVILTGAVDGSDAFWNTGHSWTNVFSIAGTTTMAGANLFDTIQVLDSTTGSLFTPASGNFSFNGTTLNWSAVPEPSGGFAVVLAVAGLLRRRRH